MKVFTLNVSVFKNATPKVKGKRKCSRYVSRLLKPSLHVLSTSLFSGTFDLLMVCVNSTIGIATKINYDGMEGV